MFQKTRLLLIDNRRQAGSWRTLRTGHTRAGRAQAPAAQRRPPLVLGLMGTPQDKYVGEWSGDKREGQGVCNFANGDIYTGGWHSDLREGHGVLPYANGDRYEGDWHEDMRWGKGKQTYATGSWYDGEWLNDIENGAGKAFLQTPQRGIFEGAFKDGLPNGFGKFAYADGDVYEGEVVDGVRCGPGKLVTSVGAVYEGDWESDQRHGQGTLRWPNGDTYTGQWSADARTGQGSMTYGNGDVFTGEWRDNQRSQGRCIYANGDDYDGEFVADERTGIGRCRFSNGDVFEGEWCQDLPQGEGMCTYANGDVYTGMFAGGMREGEGEVLLGDYSEEFLARSVYRGGWKNDRYSGLGSMVEANGDRYDGVWVDGKRQGRGTQRFVAAGERYQGIWLRDQRHGRGRHFYADGTLYDGQWRNGCRDGKGKCVYNSDSRIGVAGVFDGMWKRDKKDGRGTFEFDNGDVYNGQWRNDMRNGTGTCKYHTGEEYTGEWVDDVRKGSGGELIPRAATTADWALQSLRIAPEETRPRVPHGGVAIVKNMTDLGELKPASGELPKISGKVVDPRGAIVKDVTIAVQPTLNSLSRSLEVDDNGKFEIVGLPGGGLTMSLAFKKPGYATLETTCTVMPTCEQSNSIEIMMSPLPEPRTEDKVTLRSTFESSVGLSIMDARSNSVSIPKDALCTTDGVAYDGTAELSALPIDATAKNSFSKMPSFEGRDLDSRMCLVDLYGAMYVEIRAVPSGKQLGIRGGKLMQLGFACKVPLGEQPAPSAWAYEQQAGFWKETTSAVFAGASVLAPPRCGQGFQDEAIYSEGSSKGQDLTAWTDDVAEFLGLGPKIIRRALTPSPAPTPEPVEGEEAEAEAEAEDPPEAKPPQYENVVMWKTTRFKGTGTVPGLLYLYSKEQAALDASDGDIEGSVKALSSDGNSISAEVRMVQHLVTQTEACARARLTIPETVAALQERAGLVKDAADRLSANPIVVQRSLVAAVTEAAEQAIPFANITVEAVRDALNTTRNDSAGALELLVEQNSGKEQPYHQLCEVLTTLGIWKSKADICSSLLNYDFAVDAAAAELTGISDTATATWCKGELLVTEKYKRAKVVKVLGRKLKFCNPDDQAIEIALSLTSGVVDSAVDGLVKEWLGQQMVLQTKAQLMQTSMPWADIAPDRVKAALQEHGKREPAMQALVDEWQAHKADYDQVCSALEAVSVTKTDAEICSALASTEFDVAAAIASLSSRDDAVAESNKVQVIEGLQDKYDFNPVAEDDVVAKLEEHGDVGAALAALNEELSPGTVETDQTWWMKSYRAKVNAASKNEDDTDQHWQASLQVDSCGWWSCTKPVPAALVTGRLVSGSEPLGAAYVKPIGENYRGWSTDGRCRTDDGSFAIVAPSSAAIRLKVTHDAFDGVSPAFHTNFPGATTDLGVIDIQAFSQPDAGSPAPRFGGKRSVKDDVLKQREAKTARLVELSQSVRTILSSAGMWKSDIQIGAELAQRAMSVERVVVSLSRDSEILAKHARHQIRASIYSEFDFVPLLETSIQSALEQANGSEEIALATIRASIIKELELQARRTSVLQLRQAVKRVWNLVGPVLKVGNDKFDGAGTLEEATAAARAHAKSGMEMSALQMMEYIIYRELQENATMLSPAWKDRTSVEDIMHAKMYNMVARYNRLASTYCASKRYTEALELLRKAEFIAAQSILLTKWEDRMKVGTVTQNNLGALFRRRGDTASAQEAFDRGFALWNAADLSGPPKFPLNLKPETPISLHLNSSANLFTLGDLERALTHAETVVGAMLAMAGAVDDKLELKAQKATTEQKKAAAEVAELESKVEEMTKTLSEGEELERATVVELETLSMAAKDAAKARLAAAVLARTTCWENFDASGPPADFSRVLATAHACAADAAFALAANVEPTPEEDAPGPGEGEDLFSLAERAVLHSGRAAALAGAALGEEHALTSLLREQTAAQGSVVRQTNCMYMQVGEMK